MVSYIFFGFLWYKVFYIFTASYFFTKLCRGYIQRRNFQKEYIASVNLFGYIETSAFNRMVYWVLFFLLMLIGAAEIIVTQLKIEKVYKLVIAFSMLLGIAAVLFLALTGETYATALAFLLLVLKAGLYMKGR